MVQGVNRSPKSCLLWPSGVYIVTPTHTTLTQSKPIKCTSLFCSKLAEIDFLFEHLVPLYIWNTLQKINSHYSLKRNKYRSVSTGERLISMEFRGAEGQLFLSWCTEVEGHGGRGHLFLFPQQWSCSLETQIQGTMPFIWNFSCLSEPSWFNVLSQWLYQTDSSFLCCVAPASTSYYWLSCPSS